MQAKQLHLGTHLRGPQQNSVQVSCGTTANSTSETEKGPTNYWGAPQTRKASSGINILTCF